MLIILKIMSAAGRLQTIERLGIIMKFLDAEFVQGFIRMADDGCKAGMNVTAATCLTV